MIPEAPPENKAALSKSVKPVLPPRVAVLLPCYNEELTIGTVIRQFRAELPDAETYVFDNNSSDRTVEISRAAGAIIIREQRQDKG